MSAVGGVSDGINLQIMKARSTYVNLDHLWCRRNVSLVSNGWVHRALSKAVLLYTCESWSLRDEDVRRVFVLDHRYL